MPVAVLWGTLYTHSLQYVHRSWVTTVLCASALCLSLVWLWIQNAGVCLCVCVCVCVTPKSFKSCSNCEVQQLCPTTDRPNHEFLCSGAPSAGVRNQVENSTHNMQQEGVASVLLPHPASPVRASVLPCVEAPMSESTVCVCVCVICTFRGGSLCSVGLDASFGSGLLRPLCDVVSLPSAESEPLYFAG